MNDYYKRIKRRVVELLGDVVLFFSTSGYTSFVGKSKVDSEYVSSLDPVSVVDRHFKTNSTLDHINRGTMTSAIKLLGGKPAFIIETGSSAWGTKSSLLFDHYVKEFGGHFSTCDIRFEPTAQLRSVVSDRTTLHKSDSVSFLEKYSEKYDKQVDLVYLDSFDLDVKKPWDSAIHGLREFIALEKLLSNGSIVLIDDTPISIDYYPSHQQDGAREFYNKSGLFPGKGMLVLEVLKKRKDIEILQHEYQLLFKINN